MTVTEPASGFVLQPTYRIRRGRPVVHLFGRLEDGETFLVRDHRLVPHFYVAASDAAAAARLGASPLEATDQVTLRGEPVVQVEVATPPDTPPLRRELAAAGIATYEADVPFARRFLIDRAIRGSLEIRGTWRPGRGVDRVYDDPEVGPGEWIPTLSVLSLDIETDPAARQLLSVGLWGGGASEVLMVTPRGFAAPPEVTSFPSQRRLLEELCRRIRTIDPDVLTGWNVIEFDLAVLLRIAERLNVRLELGRGPGSLRLREPRGGGARQAMIPGRVVLDGIQLLRSSFVEMSDYSLDAVAQEVLGESKLISVTGDQKAAEILRLYDQDRRRLAEYNLADARLALGIVERLGLVELAVERSRLTGLPVDRVTSSIAAFDFLYLTELGRRRVVAPTVGAVPPSEEAIEGGYVMEPVPGLYEEVAVLDFRSLYPSLIRTFNLDPLGYLEGEEPSEPEPIRAPNGALFRRRPGILPGLLDELFPKREAARAVGDRVASYAIKILMNSFFGVLATPACRFYNPRLANAITTFGQRVLQWARRWIEDQGYEVLYGDTDSLFVATGKGEPEAAGALAGELAAGLDAALAEWIAGRWRVESRLHVEVERVYVRLFLPPVRHGTAGARKRYAGLVEEEGEGRVVFTGMEAVRRDWTDLAKEVQRELYERLFSGRPVDRYLRQVAAALRGGELDEQLVYQKGLRKDPEEYTSTTPPHVAAARKMRVRPGRVVEYVITRAGPEPAGESKSPLDYEHYVDKQLRPVAEPVLELLGISFEEAIGDERQLSLF